MRNHTPQQKQALAAEYVLGTLRGAARARLQEYLMRDPEWRDLVLDWENRLNPLSETLPERTPHKRVWRRIEGALNFDRRASRRWPLVAATLAAAASILLAVLILMQPPAPEMPRQVAVVQNAESRALWVITLDKDSLAVQSTADLKPQPGKDYELWLVAADNRPPVSLGLLPESGSATLPRSPLFDRVKVAALAVSLEPPGGSPTGAPTQVLYTTQLVPL